MDRDEVLATKQYLSNIGQWPRIPAKANPDLWLRNFQDSDQEHALALLDSIVFFNAEQTQKLASSAFHNISSAITASCTKYAERRAAWVTFVQSVSVTYPTGERPNPADSGHIFVRMFRDVIGLPESNVKTPEQVIQAIHIDGNRSPVVLVDDFAGSGDQFVKTWQRAYTLSDGTKMSLEQVAAQHGIDVYYVAAVTTMKAARRVATEAPMVKVHAAHILPEAYSACHAESVVFPPPLRPGAQSFVTRNSRRASIPGHAELGYSRLALAVGFEHSIPDATLPIIWFRNDDWIPVLERRT